MSAEKLEIARDDVADDIAAAMNEIENKELEEPSEIEEGNDGSKPAEEQSEQIDKGNRGRDETGKFTKEAKKKAKAEEKTQEAPQTETPKVAPPQSLPAKLHEKWATVPPEVRDWLTKREADHHQSITSRHGELALGREIKEIVNPYLPIIQAEGGTMQGAIKDLLNTAYQLRTGNPQQKAALMQQIAQTYGVDLQQAQTQPPLDPMMQQIMQRINGIESKFTEHSSLQEQQEHDKVMSEVSAFAADPKNVYFEQVRGKMGAFLGSKQAKDLQEAYDMACWSDPEVRSTLLKAQEAQEVEKRKADITKKKQAAVSVTGSPGVKAASSTPDKSLEEELSDVFDDLTG